MLLKNKYYHHMNKITLFKKVFLIAILFLAAACNRSDDEDAANATFFLKAKVDGQQVNMEGEYLCIYTKLPTNGFVITATNADATETFTFTSTSATLAVGNYSFQNASGNIVLGQYVKNDDYYSTMQTTGGTFSITNIDAANKIIKGTFSFSPKLMGGSTTKIITEGSFACKGIN